MKLCLIVKQGSAVEVATVPDNHRFGTHGDHFHVEITLVDILSCEKKRKK